MDDKKFEMQKLDLLNEQMENYQRLMDIVDKSLDVLIGAKARFSVAKAELKLEAEAIERAHYRVD